MSRILSALVRARLLIMRGGVAFARWIDAFWGYDVFIAHRRADAGDYAQALYDRLQREKISCFIDRIVYVPGNSLLVATRRHVAKSTLFLLVGSPELANRRHLVDWVQQEIETYLATHGPASQLIAVDFGNLIESALLSAAVEQTSAPPLINHLGPFLRISAPISGLRTLPTDDVVTAIRANLGGRRRDRTRLRFFQVVATVLIVLSTFAVATAIFATIQRGVALQQARVALSRQLAAQASSNFDSAYDLGLLLAVEANRLSDRPDVRGSLLDAVRFSPRLERFLNDGGGDINALSFGPGDRFLAAGSQKGEVTLWTMTADPPSKRIFRSPSVSENQSSVNDLGFSADGRTIAVAVDNKIELWDVVTGQKLERSFVGHRGMVTSISFSPNGTHMATGSYDGSVIIWDFSTAEVIAKFASINLGRIRSVAFSPDGKLLASGGDSPAGTEESSAIILWDVAARTQFGEPLRGHRNSVRKVVFSHDGRIMASGGYDESIILWNIDSQRKFGHSLEGHSGTVFGLAFSQDDKIIATSGYDQKVLLWNVYTQQPEQTLLGHSDRVFSIAFSGNGARIASGDGRGNIILWNANDSISIASVIKSRSAAIPNGYEFAYSSDGQLLGTSGSGNAVNLWDLGAHHLLEPPLRGHKGWVLGVAFSPDNRTLASASADHTVILWDVRSRQQIGLPLIGHKDQVLCVSFSPDGKLLASGDMDGSVILWSALSKEPLGEPIRFNGADAGSQHWIETVSFSPDGRLLAAGSRDWKVYVMDVATRQLALAPLEGHTGEVTKVSFSPDGSLLASSSSDNTVIIWDLTTGHVSGAPLVGDKSRAPLYDVVFSPDGRRLASSSMNGNIALWDLTTRQRIGAPFRGVRTRVAFSRDGRTLASAGGGAIYFVPSSNAVHSDGAEASSDNNQTEGTTQEQSKADAEASSEENAIFLLDVDPHSWMVRACRMANRRLSLVEWRQYLGNARYDPAC